MAVVTVKSVPITNRDATPAVINDGKIERGALREAVGYVQAVAGDSVSSKYIFCQVPAGARVSQVLLDCQALGAGASISLGVFFPTRYNGATVNATLFAAVQSVASALNGVDATNAAGNYGIDKQSQPLWQAAGYPSDPGVWFDIAAIVQGAIAATGNLGIKVRYCDNSN